MNICAGVARNQVTCTGYLVHQKQRRLKTLQQDYAWGPMVVLERWSVSYERGSPVMWSQVKSKSMNICAVDGGT